MKTVKFIWATSLCVALSMGIASCGHEHEYVDLGLSVKWATCNVGASSPEEYGDYYAWGETETKDTYDWSTYKWCKGSRETLTKYCNDSEFGTVDDKMVLESSDDVAQVKWGGKWRMPTKEEIEELRENCTWTETTQGGKNGYRVTSQVNGNSIFLPAAGYRDGSSFNDMDSCGSYWSTSLYTNRFVNIPYLAQEVDFKWSIVSVSRDRRCEGLSVRPVCP